MNREIRFRAWDGKWMSTFGIEIDGSGRLPLPPNPAEGQPFQVLMQYTGLKDKNGKDVYEGDILGSYEGEDLGWERHGVVTYQSDRAQFWLMEPPTYEYASESELCSEGDEWKTLEIIGNIYENPELLADNN